MKRSLILCATAAFLALPAHLASAQDEGETPAAPAPAPAPKAKAKPAVKPKAKAKPAAAEGDEASANATPVKSYRVAYGMAGCGIGSLIVTNHEKGPQIGAWFLNNLLFQCSIISSTNGSNCENGPDKQTAQVEQEVFVSVNLAGLERDAAQGHGEALDAFAEILGCDSASDRARLGELSQGQYNHLFATSEPQAVLRNYLHAMQQDSQLAKGCSRADLADAALPAQLSSN